MRSSSGSVYLSRETPQDPYLEGVEVLKTHEDAVSDGIPKDLTLLVCVYAGVKISSAGAHVEGQDVETDLFATTTVLSAKVETRL